MFGVPTLYTIVERTKERFSRRGGRGAHGAPEVKVYDAEALAGR
ncbi:hypothetical protein ACWEN6_23925 [Sphaerisporangium sp. NPDC004334]